MILTKQDQKLVEDIIAFELKTKPKLLRKIKEKRTDLYFDILTYDLDVDEVIEKLNIKKELE